MSAWIGPLGALIEFKCPSAVESDSEDPHVYFRPLGGDVSVTRLGDPTRPRVWSVSVSAARPDQVATLEALNSGSFGPGPWAFIPPAAETLNLLGKRDALAMGTPGSGYIVERPGTIIHTTEGPAGTGYGATTSSPSLFRVGTAPVIPGQPVTGKAWVSALDGQTGMVRLSFYSAGHTLLTNPGDATTGPTTGKFLSVTRTAPAGAAYVALGAQGNVVTRPQVTWTAEPRTWSPSAASQNVIMSPLTNSVRRAVGGGGEEQITDHAFTAQELTA